MLRRLSALSVFCTMLVACDAPEAGVDDDPELQALAEGEVEAVCGNAIVEDFEECDDGNDDDEDGCNVDCAWTSRALEALTAPGAALEGNFHPCGCLDPSRVTFCNGNGVRICNKRVFGFTWQWCSDGYYPYTCPRYKSYVCGSCGVGSGVI